MALARSKVQEIYDRECETYDRATKRLKELLEILLKDLSEPYGVREGVYISGEVKGFKSFYDKVRESGVADPAKCVDVVRDFARARVVVQTLDDVDRLLEMLDNQDTVVLYPNTAQDYISNPQARGYRGYHIDVGVDVSQRGRSQTIPCELQIRTTIQDAWGGFSHKDFYKGREIPPVFEEQMQEMSALLAAVDRMAASLIRNLNAPPLGAAPKPKRRASTTKAKSGGSRNQMDPRKAKARRGE